jgi:hypothetical protein
MRALVLARTAHPVPMEMASMMAQGFKQWREQYRNKMEYFAWFTSGTGGCAIATVENETELFQMMASWPLTPYSDVQIHVLVDGDEALSFWSNMIESRTAGSQG